MYKFRCPTCSEERRESVLQQSVREYLESIKEYYNNNGLFLEIKHEDGCSIICPNINMKDRRGLMPYDNEIIASNFNLIIEVHGEQHYKVNLWAKSIAKRNGTTPQEELEYIQWKDQYKMDYALSQGYYYLAIPYWTEKDGSWQTLIDNKLEEIYNDISQRQNGE